MEPHKALATGGAQAAKPSVLDLPFVADVVIRVPGKRAKRVRKFWAVEPAASYRDACSLGAEYAAQYVAALNVPRRWIPLTWIIKDIDFTNTAAGYEGIWIGFFCSLMELLRNLGRTMQLDGMILAQHSASMALVSAALGEVVA